MGSTTFQLGDFSFSWDIRKSKANFKKHSVTFEEAATCWLDDFALETFDNAHSETEMRWLIIANSDLGRLVTCWYTERQFVEADVIRIIGARLSTDIERRLYYER